MSTELYRAMKRADDERPLCEDSARGLGARVPTDIGADSAGDVHPETGGMSVTPDDPTRMNMLRRPRALGGLGKDPLWVLDDVALTDELTWRRDPADPEVHAFVEPVRVMPLESYRHALCETRNQWRPS